MKKSRELKVRKAVSQGVKIRLPMGLKREIGRPQLRKRGNARMVIKSCNSKQ